MAFDIQALNPSGQVSLVYLSYFGRAPDRGGLDYWLGDYARYTDGGIGGSTAIRLIADGFQPQIESVQNYPFLADPRGATRPDVEDFLSSVYFNLFNRGPDRAGLDYWADEILDKLFFGQPITDIILSIAGGAQGPDIDTLSNKLEIADFYVSRIEDEKFSIHSATVAAGSVNDTASSLAEARQDVADYDAYWDGDGTGYIGGRSTAQVLVSDLVGGDIYLADSDDREFVVAETGLNGITDIALADDGTLFITTGPSLYGYDFRTDDLDRLGNFSVPINALEIDGSGRLVAMSGDTDALFFVDTSNANLVEVARMGTGASGDLASNPYGVLMTGQDDTVRFYDYLEDDVSVVFSDPIVSTAWGLVDFTGATLLAAGDNIISRFDSGASQLANTFEDDRFAAASGASYVFDSTLDII